MTSRVRLYTLTQLNAQLDQCLSVFTENGSFMYEAEDEIRLVVRDNNVPDKHGAYVVFGLNRNKNNVMYIGRSGTMNQNGEMSVQTLKGRLANKQGNEPRQLFFQRMLRECKLDCLKFIWFVSYDQDRYILPVLAESLLLQAYFAEYRKLPPYNKTV